MNAAKQIAEILQPNNTAKRTSDNIPVHVK